MPTSVATIDDELSVPWGCAMGADGEEMWAAREECPLLTEADVKPIESSPAHRILELMPLRL